MAWWSKVKSVIPERAKQTKGAIPVPVAIKTGFLLEDLKVKYPCGPVNFNWIPSAALARCREKLPWGT